MSEAKLREALDYVLRNRLAISKQGVLVERDTPPVPGYGGWYEHEVLAYVRETLDEALKRVTHQPGDDRGQG